MSGSGDRRDCERLADNAAYALWALTASEAEAHRAHLTECPACRAELDQLQPTADLLAVGVRGSPAPEGLRARIMPTVRLEAESATSRAARAPTARLRRRPRLAPALAAALALVVGLVVGALALGSKANERTEVIHAIVIAPGHHAAAQLRRTGGHLELVVVGMPAPPPGHIYEVWLEHGTSAPEPTDALFSVTTTGSGSVGVPGDLNGVSKVLVTAEPLGGTLKPTREPVIVGSI
jgi:hypothetical protein